MIEPKIKWKMEVRKVADLKNYEKNPRKITEEAYERLKNKIINEGFHDIFKILPDGTILSGNQRKRILLDLGFETVDVKVPDMDRPLTQPEIDAIVVGSNFIDGVFDWDMMGNQYSVDFLLAVGFDKKDLGLDFSKEETDDDAFVDDITGEPQAKLGDVYKLGNHRIICGDSVDPAVIDKLMGGVQAEMVFTDPPYNVDYTGGMSGDNFKTKRKKIANDKMSSEDFYQFLFKAFTTMIKHTKGAFYVCMSSSELHNLWKAFTDAGGHWQTYIIWAKDHFTLSRSDYQHKFEPIMYGLKEEVNVEDKDALPIMYGWNKHHNWYGGRKQGDVWMVDRPKVSKEHPTMKPIDLMIKAIQNSSLVKDVVLDPFLGSGSTLIACENCERVCYGCELDPHYVDVIIKRWQDKTGKVAQLVERL